MKTEYMAAIISDYGGDQIGVYLNTHANDGWRLHSVTASSTCMDRWLVVLVRQVHAG